MRQIVLDTETTGLDPTSGHRVIEIGCVELQDRRITGNHFHLYINPQRESDPEALAVHGLTQAFLSDKPLFAEIAQEFLDYVRGAEVIIHNAAFDMRFLNHEMALAGHAPLEGALHGVVDTIALCVEKFGRRLSLDALCKTYEVDNSARSLHGALLDSELLAEVYLHLTRHQNELQMEDVSPVMQGGVQEPIAPVDYTVFKLPVLAATEQELSAHENVLNGIDESSSGQTIWRSAEKNMA